MIKYFGIILLFAVLFVPVYGYSEPLPPEGPECPCNTADLDNIVTGNEILQEVCPGGSLGPDSEAIISLPDEITVSLVVPPFSKYSTDTLENGTLICSISQSGIGTAISILDPEQFEACTERLITACNLEVIRPIPTLSEWGLIALAGVLGIIGLVIIRRRAVAST